MTPSTTPIELASRLPAVPNPTNAAKIASQSRGNRSCRRARGTSHGSPNTQNVTQQLENSTFADVCARIVRQGVRQLASENANVAANDPPIVHVTAERSRLRTFTARQSTARGPPLHS